MCGNWPRRQGCPRQAAQRVRGTSTKHSYPTSFATQKRWLQFWEPCSALQVLRHCRQRGGAFISAVRRATWHARRLSSRRLPLYLCVVHTHAPAHVTPTAAPLLPRAGAFRLGTERAAGEPCHCRRDMRASQHTRGWAERRRCILVWSDRLVEREREQLAGARGHSGCVAGRCGVGEAAALHVSLNLAQASPMESTPSTCTNGGTFPPLMVQLSGATLLGTATSAAPKACHSRWEHWPMVPASSPATTCHSL